MTEAPTNATLILVTRNGMGQGETELQQKLIQNYFRLLDESNMLPGAVAFYAEGVHLVTEGSRLVEVLRSLERKGVHIILCKTCLNHYGLEEKVQVGVVGGMTDIIAAQWAAEKVISI